MISNCERCGKVVEPVRYRLMGRDRAITPRFCFDCTDAAYEESEAVDRASKVEDFLYRSRIPAGCKEVLNSDFVLTPGQKKASTVLDQLDIWGVPSPYIWGSVGCGKTFLASSLAYSYIKDRCQPAHFLSVSSLISTRYSSFESDPSEIRAPIILDDLGNHIINQKIVASLFNIINFRLNENLPTIVTCNTDPVSLATRFVRAIGESESYLVESLCDRILELCKPIKVEGKSIRTERFIAENS